jgi:uncharacterized membrane protein YdjX (TVP38/TMEM64 family)
MPALSPAQRKKLLFRLGLAGLIAVAIVLFLLKGVHILTLIDRVVAFVAGLGPWVFFTAMAIVPACGVPTLGFTLVAGSAFAERMGMAWVVVAVNVAMTINMALTYWLARWVLRDHLARLLERLGYRMPEVDRADITDLIVILRVTPGVPYFVQNYLLGLADAPVGCYFLLSCLFVWPNNAAFTVFGDALLHGRGEKIVVAVLVIIALVAATHMLRRHYGRRKAVA